MNVLIGDIGNTVTKICLTEIKKSKIKKIIYFNSNNIKSRKALKKNLKKIIKQDIKINIIGKKTSLPKDIIQIIKLVEKKTFNNKRIVLNLALNYGSKEEILNAFKMIFKEKRKNITIEKFEENLYTKNIPDPDLMIRTGGTKRLSNFLLWQLAYAEIFFVNKLWPEFNENDYYKIIKKFYKIKRNFGKI